jgi:hypothetical protein
MTIPEGTVTGENTKTVPPGFCRDILGYLWAKMLDFDFFLTF